MPDLHAPDVLPTPQPASDGSTLQRQLAQAQAELAALRQEQAALAHGLSHDLRAPLRAIEAFSALAEADAGLTPAGRAHLARVRAAATRMGGLIDALLELSRANRAELNPEPVDLGLLVDCAVAAHLDAEPARPVQLQVDPALHVHGDERLLRVLVRHLVDNAWRYSQQRERVWIRARGARVGARLQVELHDQGCGFEMRYADKVFQPFQRLAGSEQGGGHGLGLAIAQRIVERHGGRLLAQSTPGVGSCFSFDLAAAPPA